VVTDLAVAPAPGLLADDALVERILEHVDRGTTDLSDATWREPVAHYRSEERLRREMDVLRGEPVLFCPSAALASPGSYLARDAAGVPIVAVRGHDGVVRAFRNACRHRGTVIASGEGCSPSLVCPYHGWVYRLDGALRHVPDEHGFPDLDKDARGLVSVAAVEHGGMVFVRQDGAPLDPEMPDGPVPELLGAHQELVGRAESIVASNWKILVEGFLEGYHIKATHPDTFFPFGYDNLTVVETFGRHSRVTFPFRRIEALRAVPRSERDVDRAVTSVYHLFPNVIVARLSHHTTVVVLEPRSTDTTNFVTYQLTNHRPAAGRRADASRDADFVALGAAEDLGIAQGLQRGLASGANETLEFGRFEGAITHFHRQLTELVTSPGAPPRDRT
jgi:phenylpropionate dioxygenase-like ring-hydroxylating dioxygenase large terminal subunit